MIRIDRQNEICRLLEKNGTVSVKAVAQKLNVSEVTIRRDFEELGARGLLRRVHGGAAAIDQYDAPVMFRDYSRSIKQTRHAEEKRAIGQIAASLTEEGQAVYLAAGTTVESLVPFLPKCRLRIVTNSLPVFNELSEEENYDLFLIGGSYDRHIEAFTGSFAEEFISRLGTDIAFVSSDGVDGSGISSAYMEEAEFQRCALSVAKKRILLADSSKIGEREFFTFFNLSDLDAIVVEPDAPQERIEKLGDYASKLLKLPL